jgi:hypothetical protein
MFSRESWRKPTKIRELRPHLESIAKNEGATPSCYSWPGGRAALSGASSRGAG